MKPLRCLSYFLLCALLSSRAHALPPNEVDTEFYAEAQHKRLVGERILSCSGGVHTWGRVTAFALRSSAPCGPHHLGGSVNAEKMMFRLHGLSCEQKCARRFPPKLCGPDEACGAEAAECLAACKPS